MDSRFYWLCKDYDLSKAESVFMLLLLPGAVQDFILIYTWSRGNIFMQPKASSSVGHDLVS